VGEDLSHAGLERRSAKPPPEYHPAPVARVMYLGVLGELLTVDDREP
jgi:hypothetical protein